MGLAGGSNRMTGRPSTFSQELADVICDGLVEGKSLRRICAGEGMPSASTVCRWLGNSAAFREQYARAREAQADALFDEILDIADDSRNDVKIVGREGEEYEVCNTEFVQRARLRVDARKWMASKLQPKKYGDKVDLNHGGEVGMTVNIKRYTPEPDGG